jgi:hypothetical protein
MLRWGVLARGWQRSSPRAISSHQGRAHPRAASPEALSLRLVGCPSLLDGGRAAVCWPERQKDKRSRPFSKTLFRSAFFSEEGRGGLSPLHSKGVCVGRC